MLNAEIEYYKGWRLESTPPLDIEYKELLSPWGEIIRFSKNCEVVKKYGLTDSQVCELLTKRKKSAKGWKLPYPKDNYHEVLSPDGVIHKVYNVSDFGKEHELNSSNFNRLLRGQAKSHKGWKLLKYNETVITTRT